MVIILTIVLVALPIVYKIKADSQELVQKKQETESFFIDWQNLKDSKKDYQEIQDSLKDLTVFLPPDRAIDFILTLEKFAAQTQNQQTITVLTNKQTPLGTGENADSANSSGKETGDTIFFQVALKGIFPNLVKFRVYLENAPYYNDVNSLTIQSTGGTGLSSEKNQSGYVDSNIILSVYQKK